jgi:hypothetical protein
MSKLEAVKRVLFAWPGRIAINIHDTNIYIPDAVFTFEAGGESVHFNTLRRLRPTELSICFAVQTTADGYREFQYAHFEWSEHIAQVRCVRNPAPLQHLDELLAGRAPEALPPPERTELSLDGKALAQLISETILLFESQSQQFSKVSFEHALRSASAQARFVGESIRKWLQTMPGISFASVYKDNYQGCLLTPFYNKKLSSITCGIKCWEVPEKLGVWSFELSVGRYSRVAFAEWDNSWLTVVRPIMLEKKKLRRYGGGGSRKAYPTAEQIVTNQEFSIRSAFYACVELFDEFIAHLAEPSQPLNSDLTRSLLVLLRGFSEESSAKRLKQ